MVGDSRLHSEKKNREGIIAIVTCKRTLQFKDDNTFMANKTHSNPLGKPRPIRTSSRCLIRCSFRNLSSVTLCILSTRDYTGFHMSILGTVCYGTPSPRYSVWLLIIKFPILFSILEITAMF